MLLAELAATSDAVAATKKRTAKRAEIARLLERLDPEEARIAIGFLIGTTRQGRIGIGWATLANVEAPAAADATLTIRAVDTALDQLAATSGPGSAAARSATLRELIGSATAPEADFLRRLLLGELRQGANDGVVLDAIADAAHVPPALVRRAAMLGGDVAEIGRVALVDGRAGLEAVRLEPGRPILPMLASTASSVAEAIEALGRSSVEWKLDGARIQVHRAGTEIRVFTRNLNDVTDRLPSVVETVRSLDAHSLVLDGETLATGEDGRPTAFADTMSTFGADDATDAGNLAPFFFDVLHHDGADLVDEPLGERLAHLESLGSTHRIPGRVTDDAADAERVLDEALAAGHEGVMVKSVGATYTAGRRGKAWRKVKPVHTLDLVVVAAEWGHGRRRGWLSNLHLAARGPDGYVMVGKTFKGLTDELLAWQTEQLLARATDQDGITVHVHPDLVVEVALDGVQRSTRYPGGAALRFARVRRYRPDKSPIDADTIDAVRRLLM